MGEEHALRNGVCPLSELLPIPIERSRVPSNVAFPLSTEIRIADCD